MQRILIAYATREGQTEKVADRIARHLQAAGADATLVCARDAAALERLDLDAYGLLVFGASMHAGGLETELVGFVNRHAGTIRSHPRAFFLVLLSAATKDPVLKAQWLGDARAKMDEQLHMPFDDVEMIAGALMYSKYPPPLRWLMKRIAGKAGGDTDTHKDYEYTDWSQVERYAQRLADIARQADRRPDGDRTSRNSG